MRVYIYNFIAATCAPGSTVTVRRRSVGDGEEMVFGVYTLHVASENNALWMDGIS